MDADQRNEVPQVEYAPHPAEPIPLYTYLLLGGIAAVFVAQVICGGGLRSLLTGDEYSAFVAGFVKPYFLKYHEYWRILTGAAVHGGIVHVVMNGYALLIFGRLMELLTNRAHLAIVFLLACIGGGLLSLYMLPDSVSVGASGGIVGLLGYLTVYAFRRRKFISAEFRKGMLINIGFLFFFGLVLMNIVDNYGHLGGLIVGLVYGVIQIPSDEYVDPRTGNSFIKVLGVASIAIFIAACFLAIVLLFANRGITVPQI